jgi:hypothetical protein
MAFTGNEYRAFNCGSLELGVVAKSIFEHAPVDERVPGSSILMVGVSVGENRRLDAKVYFTRFAGERRPVCFGHSGQTMLFLCCKDRGRITPPSGTRRFGVRPSALQISCPQSGLDSIRSLASGIKDIKRSALHRLCPCEEIKVARP